MIKYNMHYKNVITMKNTKKLAILTLAIMFMGILPMSGACSLDELGKPHLVISAPSTVDELQRFTVHVSANGHSVAFAKVVFSFVLDGIGHAITDYTNILGNVKFVAPEVESDTVCTLHASKTGYIDAETSITVKDVPKPQLEISSLSEINEGETFNVHITADGQSVPFAKVIFSYVKDGLGNAIAKYTNLRGNVQFTAPDVDSDTVGTIHVSKDGYKDAEKSITIYNIVGQLVISVPPEVNEQQTFTVQISANSEPIQNAEVDFSGINADGVHWNVVGFTDQQGNVQFTAPDVLENALCTLHASKIAYIDAETTITVINLDSTV
jgi:hypothetical protein